MTINERLFYIMNEKNIKASSLADYLGISKTVVSNWKSRGNNPPIEYTVPICELLNVSIDYFITGEEKSIEKVQTQNQKELLKSFDLLPEREQIKFIARVEDLAQQYINNEGKLSDSKIG